MIAINPTASEPRRYVLQIPCDGPRAWEFVKKMTGCRNANLMMVDGEQYTPGTLILIGVVWECDRESPDSAAADPARSTVAQTGDAAGGLATLKMSEFDYPFGEIYPSAILPESDDWRPLEYAGS